MHLMRIGARRSEKPVARVDEETYVDLSDVVDDFDEASSEAVASSGSDRSSPHGHHREDPDSTASASERRSLGRTRSSASG